VAYIFFQPLIVMPHLLKVNVAAYVALSGGAVGEVPSKRTASTTTPFRTLFLHKKASKNFPTRCIGDVWSLDAEMEFHSPGTQLVRK
jgi:hypothetical protein